VCGRWSGFGRVDAAADVLVLVGGLDVTVIRTYSTREGCSSFSRAAVGIRRRGVADHAALRSMQRHAVGVVVVDALEDIDFAARGPGFFAEQPEGGPGAAGAGGHVCDIGY
jgi:hypothetical protein